MTHKDFDFHERREAIKAILLSGRRVSLRGLSEQFGVTRQTILKDFGKMTDFPIAVFKGPGGGYEYAGDNPKIAVSLKTLRELLKAKRDDAEFSEDVWVEIQRLEFIQDKEGQQDDEQEKVR